MTNHFYNYNGFWYDEHFLKGVVWAETHFKARPTDILLATFPKTGLTWLKALTFAIMNRTHIGTLKGTHPLLAKNPHELVPYLEFQAYEKDPSSSLDSIPSPRLLSTHISYDSLPKSVINCNCRIICIAREPKDVFVSMWSFLSKIITIGDREEPVSKGEAFELFCNGVSLLGPFWEHVLGYWRSSMEFPTRVLFLKYEDLKKETVVNVERLAEFIGLPFSSEERAAGVVEEIVKLCDIDRLKSLEVNKNGVYQLGRDSNAFVEKSAYFRKGEIGDWKNHLTEEMVKKIDQITEEKFGAYGFKY